MNDTQPTFFHIAIDGPVAAGKGTVSKLVAEELGYLYVDTGAMYRMTALLAKQHGVDFNDEDKLMELIRNSKMDMRVPQASGKSLSSEGSPVTINEQDGRLITVLLDGKDVSHAIRTPEMSDGASIVSKLGGVRELLVERQKEIAQGKSVVMEGRDITFRVLPEANLKIFLYATPEERADRRYKQLKEKDPTTTYEEVLKEVTVRDERDRGRDNDPLQEVPDAWKLNTTNKDIPTVVSEIVDRVRSMQQ